MTMEIRTVCVLGGTGFLGRHLLSRLVTDGYHVRALTRRRERHRDLLVLPTLSLIEADVHDPEVLNRELAGCDAVVNLVGILNEKGRDGSGFRRVHVELPRKVVQACQADGIRRLLHMSALNADARKGPSHYLRTKGEGEDLVHAAAGQGLQVTSFRPSVIFGPGDSFFNRFASLLKLTPPPFFPLACPASRFAPVYVGDVVQGFATALKENSTVGQRYDLCGPRAYTLRQLVEYTARELGLRRSIIGLPNLLSRLQARVFDHVPGKPFSMDNYLSLRVDSVCTGEFPAVFGIDPTPIESVVPAYLQQHTLRARYREYRAQARRQ
jgi:NADH dehydrogenase